MARVLGRIRLSRSTDESTSEDRQRAAIEAWAAMKGHDVVGWATDIDVSGSVSPFDAPELGPWLLRRSDQWDFVVGWKLDRFSRTLFNTNALFKWCQDNGKTLACVEENIDLSHWTGRLVASVIAGVAEGELEAIKSRTQSSQAELRKRGRWHGGTVPFGYSRVKRDGGWWLEIDESTAPVVREVVERALRRESIRSIADWLNTFSAAPRGGEWTAQTVTRMLTARWILGQHEHEGRVVLDETTGLPLQRAEGIITFDEWQRVQMVLSDRSRPKIRKNETGLLLNVARCSGCGELLYKNVMIHKDRPSKYSYSYYRCSGKSRKRNGCTLPSVRAERIEEFTEREFLRQIGGVERTEKVYVPASGPAEALATVEAAIAGIREERDLGLYDGDDAGYHSRLRTLISRRKQLQSQPSRPAGYETRGLGETYSTAWGRMTAAERRELLIEAGVTVHATENDGGVRLSMTFTDVALASAVPGYQFDAATLPEGSTVVLGGWERVEGA